MYQAIVDAFSPLGLRTLTLITRYIGHYAISAVEHAINNRRGYIGIAPGDLRRIIHNCMEDCTTKTEDSLQSVARTVAGFFHSFSGTPSYTNNSFGTSIAHYKYGVVHREREPCSTVTHHLMHRIKKKWAMYGEYYRDRNMPQQVIWNGTTCMASWMQAVGDGYTSCGHGIRGYVQEYPKMLLHPEFKMHWLTSRLYIGDSTLDNLELATRTHELRHHLYPR